MRWRLKPHYGATGDLLRGARSAGRTVNGVVLDIFVDADACPVKAEIYRVARRYDLKVYVVSHGPLSVPTDGRFERVRPPMGVDAADDWIATRVGPNDIAITADVPLADRCVKRGALVLTPDGRVLTEESIGEVVAGRNLMDHLREIGVPTQGPPPFRAADRSRFLARLDELVQSIRRNPERHRD